MTKSSKEKECKRKEWINTRFGSEDNFMRQIFVRARHDVPRDIRRNLEMPSGLWSEREIRTLRENAIKMMTKEELAKNPRLTPDEFWDKWNLEKTPGMTKDRRLIVTRGYYEIFEEAKKELSKSP